MFLYKGDVPSTEKGIPNIKGASSQNKNLKEKKEK